MKNLIVFAVLLLISGGCSTSNIPSVCDQVTGSSILCELSSEQGVRLEDVGNGLIIVNAIAIGEGAYTRKQAADIFKNIRVAIDSPVSYMFFRDMVETTSSNYPGLFEIADAYLAYFNTPQIMYQTDQDILKSWLDKRIKTMVPKR